MIRLIIEKELKDIIGSTKFAATFGICSLLILLAFLAGARNYQVSMEQYEAGKREALRQLEGVTSWSDIRSTRIALPPQPIASLVTGVSADIGRNIEVMGRGELVPEDSRYGEEPIYAVFRFLDLEFIFQIVLSLFAILFGYDAVTGEKERGTLRLTFSNAVPRAQYIAGKMAGAVLALAVPLLVPMLLGSLLLIILRIPMQAVDWWRLVLVILAGYAYFTVFLALALFISTRTTVASHSFLLALVSWILLVMVLPRTAVLIAGRAVDVPSMDENLSQKSRLSASLWQEDRRKMSEYRAEPGTPPDKVMESFQKFMAQNADERDRKMRELTERLNEERRNKQNVQTRLAFGLARLSPAAAFSFAVTTVAGTGVHMQDAFLAKANAYQTSFGEFIKEKTGEMPSGGMIIRINAGDEEPKKPINASELPQFSFEKPLLPEDVASYAIDMGVLVLMSLLLFAGAFVSFLRYDVR